LEQKRASAELRIAELEEARAAQAESAAREVEQLRARAVELESQVTAVAEARHAETQAQSVGDESHASRRTIHKCIHPGGAASCQLVMGFTELAPSSVWNTMPAHTHARRSEIYLYFDLGDALVVHLMGRPEATRHLIVRDRQAALSPPWSIHAGAGTASYRFIWGMAGENQDFGDMDAVAPGHLL
ncbi:MAG: 5-deoxy-glucuronate isomerase, partial [Acidobacteriota bacterium]